MSRTREKRIAFYLPSLSGGGAERVIIFLAGALADRGIPVDLVVAKREGAYLEHVPSNVRLLDFGVVGSLRAFPCLVRYLRSNKPDVLMSALERANIAAILARKFAGYRLRLVVSERTNLWGQNLHEPGFLYALTPFLVKQFYPYSDAVVAVSQGTKDALITMVGASMEKKCEVIYNPAQINLVRDSAEEEVDHPWFCSDNKIVIAAGRLSLQKDFSTLIKAFSGVSDDPSVKLVILGEGECRKDLEILVSTLGLCDRVWMPGFISNPWKYFARADLFVLSSLWEGLPNVLIEALVCGVPIVATDCPSGPFEILEGGRFGRLVPLGDIYGLCQAMKEKLYAEHRLDEKLWAESLMKFTPETVVARYMEVLGLFE
jgi:glycosyltransferase involved in cell wall biosynthesis